MNTKSPLLVLHPQRQECRCRTAWDPESLLLSLSVDYLRDHADDRPQTLGERIDQTLGIEANDFRVILGEMDILLNSHKYFDSLEIRTNPAKWSSDQLLPIPNDTAPALVEFMAEYDENRIASYDLAVAITLDRTRRELSFRFGDLATSRWVLITDGVAVGTTLDHYLSELRVMTSCIPSQLVR